MILSAMIKTPDKLAGIRQLFNFDFHKKFWEYLFLSN